VAQILHLNVLKLHGITQSLDLSQLNHLSSESLLLPTSDAMI